MADFLGLVEMRIDDLIQMAKALDSQLVPPPEPDPSAYGNDALQEPPRLDLAEVAVGSVAEDAEEEGEGRALPMATACIRKVIEKRFALLQLEV